MSARESVSSMEKRTVGVFLASSAAASLRRRNGPAASSPFNSFLRLFSSLGVDRDEHVRRPEVARDAHLRDRDVDVDDARILELRQDADQLLVDQPRKSFRALFHGSLLRLPVRRLAADLVAVADVVLLVVDDLGDREVLDERAGSSAPSPG